MSGRASQTFKKTAQVNGPFEAAPRAPHPWGTDCGLRSLEF